MGKGLKIILVILGIIFGIIIASAIFVSVMLFGGKNYDDVYEARDIVNPAEGLSLEEVVAQFDEDFVYYLLYSIKAYNLHAPFLDKDNLPKINIFVGEDVYNAKVDKGEMYVARGEQTGIDLIIRTPKEEAAKMLLDKSNIQTSFKEGKSSMELVEDKTVLASKGYLVLYSQVTGEDVEE